MDAAFSQTRMDSPAASQFRGKRVHFIGVGGSGMSGLARMLIDAGAIVSGSEPRPAAQTFELIRRGAKISRDQMGELLSDKIDLVVRTAAVPDNNCEMIAAGALRLKIVKYAQMLGMVMGERFGVAVAGTHGKSTTSAMIAFALRECGADPSFVIGGTVPQLGGSSHSGKGKIFVAEACEFDRSFHNLRPKVALITNVESDHLDYYKDIDEIVGSFRDFAERVPPDGVIIANGKDRHVMQALSGLSTPVESVAMGQEFIWSTRILGIDNGCYRGEISHRNRPVGTLRLAIAGEHNLMNATMAAAACFACGIDAGEAIEMLCRFDGVDRRMTVMGRYHGATVVDDYGHHPTEIRTTLKALRERFDPRRLICIFQPHQHSRTRSLLEDFAASFVLADETIVPDIYFVRDSEAERQRVTSADLVDRVKANGQKAVHLASFGQIVEYLKINAREDDLIVTMGAGNIWEIGRDLTSV
ncbi:MAG: UDP-N-acetylmuramate--L-alanine ligase [Tepidisphaeraceae bacterium]